MRNDYLSLKEPELVAFRRERADRLNIAITSVFPSAVFVQISNSLAVRQIRPRGVDEVEVFQTMLGYADDPPEMTLHRLRQANLVGPAGLVSMEDGEAIEIAHRASRPDRDSTTVIELGGARRHLRPRLPGHRRAVARVLVVLRRAARDRAGGRGAMSRSMPAGDRVASTICSRNMAALIDAAKFDEWLDLFAADCRYHVVPRENYERGLPAALIFCDSRAMLEDRIRALREANKYNIHTDRHLIGLPRIIGEDGDATLVEAPFAVYQTDQEGETRLFATGLYRDRLVVEAGRPQIPRQAGPARHLRGAEPACHAVISCPRRSASCAALDAPNQRLRRCLSRTA